MTDKLRLLEHAARKVESDSGFIAYLMKKYLEAENISEQEILLMLECSVEDYYKLSLCRVPDINASDFVIRLNKISQYTNTSSIGLNRILKRANSVLRLSGSDVEQHNYLIAARDKQNKDNN
jgi:hypothetical protein